MLEPIERTSLVDTVVKRLKDMILGGTLQPGDQIPSEKELCERLRVSRTAIREAKKALVGMGLLESKAGQGTFIKDDLFETLTESMRLGLQIQKGSILELTDARRILEVASAGLAAGRATDQAKRTLLELVAQMEAAVDAGDMETLRERDLAWHEAVAEAARNRVVMRMMLAIRSMLAVFVDTVLLNVPGSGRIALDGHRRVTEAIVRGDVDDAQEAMAGHLDDVESMILQRFADEVQ